MTINGTNEGHRAIPKVDAAKERQVLDALNNLDMLEHSVADEWSKEAGSQK